MTPAYTLAALCLTLAALLAYALLGWGQERRAHAATLRRYRQCDEREALYLRQHEEARDTILRLSAALTERNLAGNLGRLPRRPQDRIHVN